MKNSIIFIFLSLFLFSAKAQNTQKVSFANDTCLFKTLDLSYLISDTQMPSGTYNSLTTKSLDVPKGKFLHLKIELKNGLLNSNLANGVTVTDLVMMQQHILGIKVMNNLQMQLADINNNGTVSTADVVELRKIILEKNNNFSNNQSWRIYNNSSNKLLVNENFSILIQKDEILSFTPMKLGDMNGTVNKLLGLGSNCF